MPWAVAAMAAMHETMTTNREAFGTARVASSDADDLRLRFRCATSTLLGINLTPESRGSQLAVD
jgi:hypothetical protein